ncbi:hypothetical protein Hanom_Chr03g00211601 [Helianthus anomalus]
MFQLLGYYQSKNRPRESRSRALKLDLVFVRPPVDELMNVVYMLFDGLERGTSTVSVVTRRIL